MGHVGHAAPFTNTTSLANNNDTTTQKHVISYIVIATICESVLIVLVNLATILVIASNRRLNKRSILLLLSVAVADTIAGISAIWRFVTVKVLQTRETPVEKLLRRFIWYTGQPASINGLVLIAMERAFSTLRPMQYLQSTNRMYYFAITLQWLLVIPLAVPLSIFGKTLTLVVSKKIAEITKLFLIVVSYTAIFLKVKQQNRKNGKKSLPLTQQREMELAKTLFFVTVLSLIAWLPDILFHLITNTFPDNDIHDVLRAIRLANSLVNPMVYFLRMPDFRKTLKVALCKLMPKLSRARPVVQVQPYREPRTESVPSGFVQQEKQEGHKDCGMSRKSMGTQSIGFERSPKIA